MEMTFIRRISPALALALLLFNPAVAQKKTDREKENLLGAVRSIGSRMTYYINGELQTEERANSLDTLTYDADGNEVERSIYDDYGFAIGKEVHTRGAHGNLIESVLSNPEGEVMERRVYTYDGGKLMQIVSSDGKGKVKLKQVNSYGSDGRLREETYYDPKEAAGKTMHKYDDKGRISELAFYLPDGSKAIATIGPCLGAHRVTYSYEKKGRPVKVVAYEPDGEVKKSWRYAYNPQGQVAEDVRESAWSRMKIVYTYEYDSQGNWIKKVATVNDQSKLERIGSNERKTVVSRSITYF
ncbi:MAG: hypothetical protein H7Z38_02635 [Rubrivivax sp.]|nr:hypothetical protein [Pyrinomonadaceae bacterium]